MLKFFTMDLLRHRMSKYHILVSLIVCTLLFWVAYTVFLTFTQYKVWIDGNELTKVFTIAPVGSEVPFPGALEFVRPLFERPGGYFAFYVFGRFWLKVIILFLVSFVFYFFLKLLHKYRERFFKEGEIELGLLCALLSGWPGVVLFIPLSLFYTVFLGIFRLLVFKEYRTTLGIPFLLSAGTIILASNFLISIFGLSILTL